MNPEQLQKISAILLSLKSIVKCPICLDHVENPVELECSHRFCNICLSELRSETSLCVICKLPIGKRAPTYKDQFAEDLSKFTNRTCQLVKEKYAYEVDELCLNKTNLEEVIKTAPQDLTKNIKISEVSLEKRSYDAFDKLAINSRRCYINKKKSLEQPEKPKLLNFNNNDTRTKIISWLNDNQEKLDILTQSPQFLSEDERDFQMPSISQISTHKLKQTSKRRSQSLTVNDNLPEPFLRRYQSLNEGLNDNDDYSIEEVHSEKLVKQVERKVLQDMLEDECLANLEIVALQVKEDTKVAPFKSKAKYIPAENKTTNIHYSGSSSGWDRIKDVKKSIKRASKERKKLNINLQDTHANVRKSPKQKSIESPAERDTNKSKIKGNKTVDNKEIPQPSKALSTTKEDLNTETNKIFNLSAVENYFEQHIDNVKVSPRNDSSSDLEIDVINLADGRTKEIGQGREENVNNGDKSFDEEIFCLPTQITPHSANQQSSFCQILPIPMEFNDVDIITIRLRDSLKLCISSAGNLRNEVGHQLVECFTNLLTYADKIKKVRSDNNMTEIQVSQKASIPKKTVETQTICENTAVATQTVSSPGKNVVSKYIQTSQYTCDVGAHTYGRVCIEPGIEARGQLSTKGTSEERSSKLIKSQSINENVSPENTLRKSKKMSNKVSTQSVSSRATDEKGKILSIKTSGNSNNKELQNSVDDSKENKSSKISNIISQDSILICSLDPSSKSGKKINRMLTYEESQSRKFKRIRKPASDSDSDSGGNPSKRKFIRDDLTVEFLETVKNISNEHKDYSTPESEKMDYDKYLLEAMEKYDPSPHKKKLTPRNKSNQSIKSNSSKQSIEGKREKYQSVLQKESQGAVASGEHIFTATSAFQENLDKFDQEIFDFDRNTKIYNTEFDLVENTPIVNSKAKIPRLSNKKRDPIIQPLQIISKGSVLSGGLSRRCRTSAAEYRLSNVMDEESSTLNRNIENHDCQRHKGVDDVEAILEDLRNDDDFFKSNLECDEKVVCSGISDRQSGTVTNDVNIMDLSDIDRTNVKFDQEEKKVNVTRKNIDEVLENLNDFDDNDELEEELQKISFTAAERKVNEGNKIHILQNYKLRSQNKNNKANDLERIIDSSDISDEEIVETTPQKKKNSSFDRTLLENLKELENPVDDDAFDFCLPPPPGFGDDVENSLPFEHLRESPANQKEGDLRLVENKSSVTPDRLTDFIVTPDEKEIHTQNEESQHSLSFKPSFITPSRYGKRRIDALKTSKLNKDSESVFSPIAKTSIKITQAKYTPLVSTSRLSTRKSNLMTSTPNQKSILNYVVPSQDSPAMLSQKSKPCIMWSRILNKDLNVFTQLECKKLLSTSKLFSPLVTHLVVLVDEKGQIVSHTAKILQAIAAGIWVVRYEWAQDCLKMNRIVPEEPYEALDTTGIPGPQIARLSSRTKPLFNGFKFYCAPPLITVPKGDLESILQLSGGEIARDLGALLQNDGKVHIILTESSVTEETDDQFETWLDIYKVVTVDVEWLTSCISQYKLMSFRPFLICGDESTICDLGYPPTLVESVPYTLSEAQ